MQPVFDFVQGKLSYDEFETEFTLHPEIWTWIQQLVPENIDDSSCLFRSYYGNMLGFETNNYKVKATIMSFGYDDSYGRSVAFALISALVKFHYPDIVCQCPPEQGCYDMLEDLGLDYLGGSDVDEIIREIVSLHRSSGKKELKKALKEAFFISPRKIPHWVQEPEWPACDGVPMKFISEHNLGDKFTYEFQDRDSKEIKTIVQYA